MTNMHVPASELDQNQSLGQHLEEWGMVDVIEDTPSTVHTYVSTLAIRGTRAFDPTVPAVDGEPLYYDC
jgi:hypothetical protein